MIAVGLAFVVGCQRDPPMVLFSATPDPGNPKTIIFDASKSTADAALRIVAYEWNYGDGKTETVSEPSQPHTYSERGHYYVTLKVTDDNLSTRVGTALSVIGLPRVKVPYVVVGNSRPIPRLVASPLIVAVRQPVLFDRSTSLDSDGWIQDWRLSFGDEGRPFESVDDPTRRTTTFRYDKEGSYTASLQVWDNDGEASVRSDEVNILVKASLGCGVEIVAPVPNHTVKGEVKIRVNITGDLAVTAVDFYIDEIGPYTESTAPFTHVWDTTPLETGPHTLEAYGFAGAQPCRPSPPISVNVANQP